MKSVSHYLLLSLMVVSLITVVAYATGSYGDYVNALVNQSNVVGLTTADSPTFLAVNVTRTNISGVNVTEAPCSYGFGGDYSYLICTDGTTVYAKNGSTGKVDYSGTNAASIFQSVINNSNNLVLTTRGNFTLTENIGNLTAHGLVWHGENTFIKSTHGGAGSEMLVFHNSPNLKLYGLELDAMNTTYRNLAIFQYTGYNADNVLLQDITIRNQSMDSNTWGFIIWDRSNTRTMKNVKIKNMKVYDMWARYSSVCFENWIISLVDKVDIDGLYLENTKCDNSIYRSSNVTGRGITSVSSGKFIISYRNITLYDLHADNTTNIRYSTDEGDYTADVTLVNPIVKKLHINGNAAGITVRTTVINPNIFNSIDNGLLIDQYTNGTKIIGGNIHHNNYSGVRITTDTNDTKLLGTTINNNNRSLISATAGVHNSGVNTSLIDVDIFDDDPTSPTQSKAVINAVGTLFLRGGKIEGVVTKNGGAIYTQNVMGRPGYYWGTCSAVSTITPFGIGDWCTNTTDGLINMFGAGSAWRYTNNSLMGQ